MNDNTKRIFFESFDPRIVSEIVCMVDDDQITRQSGRKLLYAYIDAQVYMIEGLLKYGVMLDRDNVLEHCLNVHLGEKRDD